MIIRSFFILALATFSFTISSCSPMAGRTPQSVKRLPSEVEKKEREEVPEKKEPEKPVEEKKKKVENQASADRFSKYTPT
ncbi:MAG: hypothetical protein ACLFQK_08785, partial [Fibrobacterota bacterium]